MRWIALLAFCATVAGCDGMPQPESHRTIAAFEVPLPSQSERNEFLSVLRAVAKDHGMHVDAVSQQDLESMAARMPETKMTIRAAVWRGTDDDESVASVMDLHHLGQAWIAFSKGEDPVLATKFRESAMREIMRRWPDTLSLPIMPTGAIPLSRDLIRTSSGYVVDPSAAHRYQLKDPEKRAR